MRVRSHIGTSLTNIITTRKGVKSASYGQILALLEAGAAPNERDSSGYAPLHIAAVYNDVEVIGALIEFGADINIRTMDGVSWTPLMSAAAMGCLEASKYLLSMGADRAMLSKAGYLPKELAIANNFPKIALLF